MADRPKVRTKSKVIRPVWNYPNDAVFSGRPCPSQEKEFAKLSGSTPGKMSGGYYSAIC